MDYGFIKYIDPEKKRVRNRILEAMKTGYVPREEERMEYMLDQ